MVNGRSARAAVRICAGGAGLVTLAMMATVAACGDARPEPAGDLTEAAALPPHEAGAATDAGGDAALRGDADADAPPDITLCDPKATWSAPLAVALDGFAGSLLGSVTPDERVVAWTSGVVGAVTVSYAAREARTDPFGPTRTLTGAYALDRAALSPDGLTLYLVREDRRAFLQRSRASLAEAFGPEEMGPFANLDEHAALTMPDDESFGDPLLGRDARTLLYSQFGGAKTRTIHASYRLFANDTWPVGQPITSHAALDGTATMRRRPTGLSSDERTLFFFDETTGKQHAAWNVKAPDDFTTFVDLGARPYAMPNGDCDRLYYVTGLAGGVGTGVAYVARP